QPLARPVLSEIDKVVLAGLAHGVQVLPFVDRLKSLGRRGFKDIAKEFEARRALTLENSAPRPPDDALRIEIGFAMPHIRPGNRALPEAVNHFFGAEIPPALGKVAFVFDFIENNRLSINIAIDNRTPEIFDSRAVLNARVRDPGFVVVINKPAVMDRAEAIERIGSLNDLEIAVPIRRFLFLHEVE